MRSAAWLSAAALLVPSALLSQVRAPMDSADLRRWRADLAYLRTEMPARHANLYHTVARPRLDSAFDALEAALPGLARHEVIVGLQRLAAMVGDGHSNVSPWRDSLVAFHTLPVAFYLFSDGVHVRSAHRAHASLLGARVVAIGTMPVDSALARLEPLISRDNRMGVRAISAFLLAMPEVLHASGIAAAPDRVRLVVEQGGVRREVTLAAEERFPMLTGDADRSWVVRSGWVDARDAAPAPLWLRDPLDAYWYRYLPDGRALYLQINTIQHKATDSLGAFMARALAAADSAGAERVVLDLRLNGGGNGSFNKLILLPLIKSRYDMPGRLYVLTGRRTFSAAQMLVTELQKYSRAVFVGEPTASRGNHFGDSYRIVMPNSRVTLRVSTLWHQYLDPRDRRPLVEPAIAAPLSFADYASGRDPALAAAARRSRAAAAP